MAERFRDTHFPPDAVADAVVDAIVAEEREGGKGDGEGTLGVDLAPGRA
jgi:hypothetical protein